MEIVGSSRATAQIKEEVKRLSRSRRNVLVLGEQGVGKGHIAEAIHSSSKNRRKPCIRLNLAAMDPGRLRKLLELAESKGQFYNPIAPDHGNFKLVDGSTLILEDLEKSGPAVQALDGTLRFFNYCQIHSGEQGIQVLFGQPNSTR